MSEKENIDQAKENLNEFKKPDTEFSDNFTLEKFKEVKYSSESTETKTQIDLEIKPKIKASDVLDGKIDQAISKTKLSAEVQYERKDENFSLDFKISSDIGTVFNVPNQEKNTKASISFTKKF